jgi:hypothetical protein
MRAMDAMAAAAAALAAASCGASAAEGVYSSSTAHDAAACARMCDDDGLCVAWSFHEDGACELRATAPSQPGGAAHGWSRRAPEGLRLASMPAPEQTAAAAPQGAASPLPEEDTPKAAPMEDAVSRLLLGGLEVDATGLRN